MYCRRYAGCGLVLLAGLSSLDVVIDEGDDSIHGEVLMTTVM